MLIILIYSVLSPYFKTLAGSELSFSGLPGSLDLALIVRPLRKGLYFIMCGLSSPEVSLLPVGIADAHMFRSILLFK